MKFGQDVTGMSDPSLNAASYIRQPVADSSDLIMMGTLAEMGRDAWTGYNKSQLDKDIQAIKTEKETQDRAYLESVIPMSEVASTEKGLQIAWDTTSEEELATLTPEEFWKQQGEVEQIQTTNTAKLEKYKKAYEQGMMTADQMVQRVNAATKAAIARQPGLAHELIREAAFYQELAGVSDMITAQRAFEKSQKDQANKIREDENQLLKKYGRPTNVVGEQREIYLADARTMEYNTQRFDYYLKQVQVLEAEGKLEQQKVDRDLSSPETAKITTDGILSVGRTIASQLKANKYVEIYKGAGLSQVEANIRGIDEAYLEKEQALATLYARGGPQSKALIDIARKQLEEQKKLWKDVAQGGIVAEAATKRLQAAEASAKLPTVSIEHRIGITNQILAAQEKIFYMTMERPDPVAFSQMIAPLMNETNRFLTTGGVSPLNYVDPKTKQGQAQQAFLFSSQDPYNDPYRKPEEVIVENSRNMENNLKMLEGVKDPVVFMQHFDAWSKTVVEESLRSGEPIANRYSAETVTKVNKFFADVMGNAKTTGTIQYNPENNSFTILNPDKTPNQERTNRVNTMWKAAVSFNGLKADSDIDKQGSLLAKMAGAYQPPVEQTQTKSTAPNKNNPLNLTIPGKQGQFQQFDNPETGIRVASNQLDRYFTGKTTGKPLQTVEDIVGTWNNENEPGSMSKKDYVAVVAKHSGLDPTKPLDLTNPKTKAALMYGMSVAEGNKQDPKELLRIVTSQHKINQEGEALKRINRMYGATATDLNEGIGMVVANLVAAGKPITTVYKEIANTIGSTVEDVMQAEKDYRNRVRTKSGIGVPKQPTKTEESVVPEVFR